MNWKLLGFFGIVFVPSLVTLLLGYSGQDLTWMKADRTTLPFGVVTANFVNEGFERFALNMIFFALFLWGFAVVNSFFGTSRWRELVLAVAAFLSAIVGISYLISLGGQGTGSSGIVYATAGFNLGFAFVQRGWTAGIREKRWSRSTVNSFAVLAGIFLGPPAALFGGGNAIVHGVAYVLAFAAGYGIGRQSLSTRQQT